MAQHVHNPPVWRRPLPLILILLLAVLVRLPELGSYALNWDEANTLALAKLPLPDLLRVISVRDIHPPAYHVGLHFWTLLFGDSDGVFRLFTGLLGILGIWAGYRLALELGGSRQVGLYTALLSVFSPFLFHYFHLGTHHGFFYTVVLLSWLFLLKSLTDTRWRWVYAACALLVLYGQSIGAVVVFFQALYVMWAFRGDKGPVFGWVWLYAGLGLLFFPQLWLMAQPWHAAHLPEITMIHRPAGVWTLLFTPSNLLWWGQDWLFMAPSPPAEDLLLFGLLGACLLAAAVRAFWREAPRQRLPWLLVGAAPLLLIFGLSLVTGKHVYHFRGFLFAVFAVNFLLAFWLAHLQQAGRRKLVSLVLVLVLGGQLYSAWQVRQLYTANVYRHIAHAVAPHRQPGDAFLIYPGFHHLPILRYLEPAEFGLTAAEQAMDPTRENVFHMLQRDEGPYFIVSGEDMWEQADVQATFRRFQARHERVWVFGDWRGAAPHFSCGPRFLVADEDGRFWQWRCPLGDPRHCRAPLSGPDADRWQCAAQSEAAEH